MCSLPLRPRRLAGCAATDGGAERGPSYYAPGMAETATTGLWMCESCGFIYDPAEGDPDGGIPAGTAFESIPDDWFCPVCGARKSDFKPYAE